MDHSFSLIATLATALSLAFVLGFIAVKLRLPALIGYLIAGILIGPATPGYVADVQISQQLAEIGVMLLMFGVGLHFSFENLLAMRKIAIPGAIVQMMVATALGMVMAIWGWGWSVGSSFIFGVSLSCASTVVLLKALESRDQINTLNGHIAVGWLVVEDLVTVLILVLIPVLSGFMGGVETDQEQSLSIGWIIVEMLLKITAFVALMLFAGRRILPWVLAQVYNTESRELFTLCVITTAIGIAYFAAKIFSISFALGAFFAGTLMQESEYSQQAAKQTLPFREAFFVLFFVAVGMLFDPMILIDKPLHLLAVVLIIILGKSIAAFCLVRLFNYPLFTALIVSASLAQIGEFSFILAGLGVSLNLLSKEAMSLIVAGALITIALNPFLFVIVDRISLKLKLKHQ